MIRHLLTSVLFAVSLTIFPATLPQVSIRPLVDETHHVVCTASSINGKIGLFVTANHCKGNRWIAQPHDDGTWQYHVVIPVLTDDAADVAVLFTPTLKVEPLRLATREPVVDDAVVVLGFPLGFTELQRIHGTVSNTRTHVFGPANPFTGDQGEDYGEKTMFQMPVCGGHSGSPVLNTENQIVSIVQLRLGSPSCAPLMGGVPFQTLSALIGRFFE